MANIDKIKFFAEGGILEFESRDYKGTFLGWEPVTDTILLACIDHMRVTDKYLPLESGFCKRDGRKCRHCCEYYTCKNSPEVMRKPPSCDAGQSVSGEAKQ